MKGRAKKHAHWLETCARVYYSGLLFLRLSVAVFSCFVHFVDGVLDIINSLTVFVCLAHFVDGPLTCLHIPRSGLPFEIRSLRQTLSPVYDLGAFSALIVSAILFISCAAQ